MWSRHGFSSGYHLLGVRRLPRSPVVLINSQMLVHRIQISGCTPVLAAGVLIAQSEGFRVAIVPRRLKTRPGSLCGPSSSPAQNPQRPRARTGASPRARRRTPAGGSQDDAPTTVRLGRLTIQCCAAIAAIERRGVRSSCRACPNSSQEDEPPNHLIAFDVPVSPEFGVPNCLARCDRVGDWATRSSTH